MRFEQAWEDHTGDTNARIDHRIERWLLLEPLSACRRWLQTFTSGGRDGVAVGVDRGHRDRVAVDRDYRDRVVERRVVRDRAFARSDSRTIIIKRDRYTKKIRRCD